MKTDYKDIF